MSGNGWYSVQDFKNKCDNEGGVFEAILGYGLGHESLTDEAWESLPHQVQQDLLAVEDMKGLYCRLNDWACSMEEEDEDDA